MKYTIEAIENAKPGMRWEEIGCQWTLGPVSYTHLTLPTNREV